MDIGIPKEIRPSEYRVGLSPAGVQILSQKGHTCYVESDAGLGAGFTNLDYEKAGGNIVYSAEETYGRADLVLKFSRPTEGELKLIRPEATLMGFLYLASAQQSRIDFLLEKRITAISYDQIQLPDGSRPVMRPLSEIGGRITAQVGARLLQNNSGGKGILLGGIAGVPPAEVVVIGGGIAGRQAAKAFMGMGAQLTILDIDAEALQRVHAELAQAVTMLYTETNVELVCSYADVLVTAAAVHGQRAPLLIRREHLKMMKPRAIIMDLSMDLGGCVESSHPTTHSSPTFVEENVVHYCVPNIGGVVARTAAHGFFNVAMPYILEVAQNGVEDTIADNPAIAGAVNTYRGEIRNLSRIAPA